jgi:hypothetical protein
MKTTKQVPDESSRSLDALDPRSGDGKDIADKLEEAYQVAYDKFAGPPKFRHSVNYDIYHRAGLLGMYRFMKRNSV